MSFLMNLFLGFTDVANIIICCLGWDAPSSSLHLSALSLHGLHIASVFQKEVFGSLPDSLESRVGLVHLHHFISSLASHLFHPPVLVSVSYPLL